MKQTEKRRLTVPDVFFIFLLLLCLIGSLLRIFTAQKKSDVEEPITLHVLLSACPAQMTACLSLGEPVYTASGEPFGEIMGIEKRPAQVTILSNGYYYTGEWESELRVDLHLMIAVQAQRTDHGILCSGSRLAIGSTLPQLYTKRSGFCGTLYKTEP